MRARWILPAAMAVGLTATAFAQVRARTSTSFVRPAPTFLPGPMIVGGPPVIVGGPPVIVGGPPVIVRGPSPIVGGPPVIVGGPAVIVRGPAPIVGSAFSGRPVVPPAQAKAPPLRPLVWVPGHWVQTGRVTRYVPGHFQ